MTGPTNTPSPELIRLGDTERTIFDPDEDVRGRRVVDVDGEDLGKVTDLLIDTRAEHVRFLLVEHGGILGLGTTKSYLPVDAVAAVREDDVLIDRDLRTVAGAPEYDPDITDDASFYRNTYGYYGVTPYWQAGYVAPRFPGIMRHDS